MPAEPTLKEALAKLEELLDYRLPQSHKPSTAIVLARGYAEVIYRALLKSSLNDAT